MQGSPGYATSTPVGSSQQSQIAVVRLSHEASLHRRSASPMCACFGPSLALYNPGEPCTQPAQAFGYPQGTHSDSKRNR